MLIRVAEPHPLLAERLATVLRARGDEPVLALHEVDSSALLHDEAALLDADELADARAALVEDGIFPEREWTDDDLRAAIKYGWALADAAARAGAPRTPAIVLWSVAAGRVPTSTDELRFIADELRRRAAAVTHIAPCWPVTIEPAVDFGEHGAAFESALAAYADALRNSGFGLFIPNAAGKTSLPAQPGALLDLTNAAWLDAARVLARAEPALFRRVLACAQEHFAFDKPREAILTTEDDIRALPEVPDADLERVFLDDPRGRQLLHVTARSIFAEPALRGALEAFLASHAA